MSDPERWRDDPLTDERLRAALTRARPVRPLDRATRSRVGVRLGRLGAAPLTAAAWLTVKSAAALGIAGGVTAAGALAVAEHYGFLRAGHAAAPRSSLASDSSLRAAAPRARPRVAPPSPSGAEPPRVTAPPSTPSASTLLTPNGAPPLNPSADLPRGARSGTTAREPAPSTSLAEESRLLERARRALPSAPGAALELLAEHAARFPSGQLVAERHLIEVEALYRAGHTNEADALARRLLATSDLYARRLEELLREMHRPTDSP